MRSFFMEATSSIAEVRAEPEGNIDAQPSLIAVIGRNGVGMLLHPQLFSTLGSQQLQKPCTIRYPVDPLRPPARKIIRGSCFCMISAEELIVPAVITLNRGWVRAEWLVNHRRDQKSWNHSPIGIAGDRLGSDELLSDYDDFLRSPDRLLHHSEISPAVCVAFLIGTLYMGDGYVGDNRAHGVKSLFGFERGNNLIKEVISSGHVASHRGPCRQKRHTHCSGLQGKGNSEVRHIKDANAACLNRAAEVISLAHHYVADPGRDDVLHASSADDLVEEAIRDGADQAKIALLLPDHFVACGKRNHLLELQSKGYGRTIGNKLGDRLAHGTSFAFHSLAFPRRFALFQPRANAFLSIFSFDQIVQIDLF